MSLKILLVEDELLLLEATREDLTDLGHEVLCAMSGDEAIKTLANSASVDVLITDIRMPGSCDGWELASRARELLPDLKVIYISGYSTVQHQPVDESVFLSKPFRLAELSDALAAISRQ